MDRSYLIILSCFVFVVSGCILSQNNSDGQVVTMSELEPPMNVKRTRKAPIDKQAAFSSSSRHSRTNSFGLMATNQPPLTSLGKSRAEGIQTLQRGKIITINSGLRYVVIDFGLTTPPGEGSIVHLFRQGIKVAEVRITGPQREAVTAGDILIGDPMVGDEVRVIRPGVGVAPK